MGKHSESQICTIQKPHGCAIHRTLLSGFRRTGPSRGGAFRPPPRERSGTAASPRHLRAPSEPLRHACPVKSGGKPGHHRPHRHQGPCGRNSGSRRRTTLKAEPAAGGTAQATAPRSPSSSCSPAGPPLPALPTSHSPSRFPPGALAAPALGSESRPRPRPALSGAAPPRGPSWGRAAAVRWGAGFGRAAAAQEASLSELNCSKQPSFDLNISYGQVRNLHNSSFGAVLITVSEVPR